MKAPNVLQKLKTPLKLEARVYANGKTTIPAAIKLKLNIRDGESVIYIEKGDDFIITTRRHILEHARNVFQNCKNKFTVDDFIAERHEEAKREIED